MFAVRKCRLGHSACDRVGLSVTKHDNMKACMLYSAIGQVSFRLATAALPARMYIRSQTARLSAS